MGHNHGRIRSLFVGRLGYNNQPDGLLPGQGRGRCQSSGFLLTEGLASREGIRELGPERVYIFNDFLSFNISIYLEM